MKNKKSLESAPISSVQKDKDTSISKGKHLTLQGFDLDGNGTTDLRLEDAVRIANSMGWDSERLIELHRTQNLRSLNSPGFNMLNFNIQDMYLLMSHPAYKNALANLQLTMSQYQGDFSNSSSSFTPSQSLNEMAPGSFQPTESTFRPVNLPEIPKPQPSTQTKQTTSEKTFGKDFHFRVDRVSSAYDDPLHFPSRIQATGKQSSANSSRTFDPQTQTFRKRPNGPLEKFLAAIAGAITGLLLSLLGFRHSKAKEQTKRLLKLRDRQ